MKTMTHVVPAVWMRGGTSKCWVFERDSLDVPGYTLDETLLRLYGSPDPRQIDGVGGGTSTTSKAVILSPSSDPDVDVEYTFAQVGIDEGRVDWGSNCGNCSAVVAPYALDQGWVRPHPGETLVRTRNTNTGQLILQRVSTPDCRWDPQLDTHIPGVPFPGTAVGLGFVDPAGRTTGSLLPTGNPVDVLEVQGVEVEATLLDAGAPLVIISPATAGLAGIPFGNWQLEVLPELERLDAIRRAGAVAMGLAPSPESAARAVPKLAIAGPLDASADPSEEAAVQIMMLSMGNPHPALAITGSVGLTIAAGTPDSVVFRALAAPAGQDLKIRTPAGIVSTWRRTLEGSDVVGSTRTARVLARATLPIPSRGSDAAHSPSTPKENIMPTPPEPELDDVAALPRHVQLPDPPRHSRRSVLSAVGLFAALGLSTTIFGGSLLNPPATTEDGDFAGETIELTIPLAEGGGTDTWARFIGSEMVHFIPGTPGFAPTNESGGEGITGSNHFATSARDNGTELLVSTASTVVPWVLGRDAVKYSFDELTPILVNGTGGVIYGRTGAGVNGLSDLVDRDKPLVFGGISATGLDLTTLVAFDLLEAETTATFGFEGRGPVNLALQRGEVDIDYTTTSSYASAVKGIVEEDKATVLMSFGQLDAQGNVARDPNFPDVPTVVEAYKEIHGTEPAGEKLEAYKTLLGLTYTYQKGLWAPAGTPAKAVELLRESAHKMSEDTAFNDKADTILGGYPISADAQLPQRVAEAYTVTDSTRQYVQRLLHDTYDITVE
ncbi:tripartite tricarboxylate transporter substrate-binding protein [Paeniglutamicibacter sp. ZC-3]|uniref:PrpF domain-containing protein n=1 Tax=Paeniglutamicibacter sp. ZC-3 TaxID=2986919 RepID=UPI0021F7608F|nr:PrpF domain-containing protein [Paeniglutamicibacter sp. ZC-3]MCV9993521.1 tripartite tricarboxylate transporter substrate-binding protein [Paeniglutamicibacter sp. ZC-3]